MYHTSQIVKAHNLGRLRPIFPIVPGKEKEHKQYLEDVTTAIDLAQHFEFTFQPFAADWQEILASAEGMVEMDLFKLPFKQIYIENSVKFKSDKLNKEYQIKFAVLAQHEPNKPDWLRLVVFFNAPNLMGVKQWADPGVHILIKPASTEARLLDNDHLMIEIRTTALLDLPPSDADHAAVEFMKTLSAMSGETVVALIVYLATRGTSVTREAAPQSKSGSKARVSPQNSRTVIRVHITPEAKAYQRTQGEQFGGERLRPRLHLRRGHVRRQHHGLKNQEVKKVWIAPTLVGHEEDGKITHGYEVHGSIPA